jgi:oxygen-independent coproporphyrinogen III oxidase
MVADKKLTMESFDLLKKYDIPVPRYTSYPTVPVWNQTIDPTRWKKTFKDQFRISNQSNGISLYIHLPFCESLCTYCGCNKKITTNHNVEAEYIEAIIREWHMYCELMEEVPVIREIHLGGGTPTFFSPENLTWLINAILENSIIHAHANFSLEGHPNNTTREHLEALYQLGFRRISYGVQDNDPVVQKTINRIQPFENVKKATETAREIGFQSINFDLIYGLPHQTLESIKKTVRECISLAPDRFAFYSYAHVPWTSRGQRLFDENDLPDAALKMALYQEGKKVFIENNYQHLGMDHFVLRDDELFHAWEQGTLHRNFMGYTAQYTDLQLGLGVSAIGDAVHAFAQNAKSLHEYYERIQKNELPVEKGYFLSQEDEEFRKYIQDISCRGVTYFNNRHQDQLKEFTFPELEKLEQDGLVHFDDKHVQVTGTGRSFIRNICRAFDLHLLMKNSDSDKQRYSKAI